MPQGLHDHLANIIVAYAAINITQINKVNGQAHKHYDQRYHQQRLIADIIAYPEDCKPYHMPHAQ